MNKDKDKIEWEVEFEKICPAKCEVFIGEEKIVCNFSEYIPKLKSFIRQTRTQAISAERERIREWLTSYSHEFKNLGGESVEMVEVEKLLTLL